jgi:hypothetical protein
LHCDLNGDANTNAGIYTITPAAGALFKGNANATFDNGTKKIYWVQHADALTPAGTRASVAINYSGGGPAGVYYDGSAGGGKVVLLGFPFETIASASLRNDYMADILNSFMSGIPPRLELLSIGLEHVRLGFHGPPNATFAVESTSNFIEWTAVTNFVNVSSTFEIVDTQAANPGQRFYRVKQLAPAP